MSNEPANPESVEVDTTKQSKGKIVFSANFPTPTLLARITKALRYFAVSLITMVSATDLFDGGQAKIISFCLGVFILLTGAVDIMIGVKPDDKNEN